MVRLNAMRASDEISEDQYRQLLFDLEESYNKFHDHVKSQGK